MYISILGAGNAGTVTAAELSLRGHIEIASAALNRNLRLEGRTVERLGVDISKQIFQEASVNQREEH